MPDEIPPPAPLPSLTGRQWWYYAGPVLTDGLVLVCTTAAVMVGKLDPDVLKYVIGALVAGNMALRLPGRGMPPPGGGGLVWAIVTLGSRMKGTGS